MTDQNVSRPTPCRCTADPCKPIGPFPATAVTALAGLGLNDREIAGYFGIAQDKVRKLRLETAPELTLVGTTLVPRKGKGASGTDARE